jgi:hypothetical protein
VLVLTVNPLMSRVAPWQSFDGLAPMLMPFGMVTSSVPNPGTVWLMVNGAPLTDAAGVVHPVNNGDTLATVVTDTACGFGLLNLKYSEQFELGKQSVPPNAVTVVTADGELICVACGVARAGGDDAPRIDLHGMFLHLYGALDPEVTGLQTVIQYALDEEQVARSEDYDGWDPDDGLDHTDCMPGIDCESCYGELLPEYHYGHADIEPRNDPSPRWDVPVQRAEARCELPGCRSARSPREDASRPLEADGAVVAEEQGKAQYDVHPLLECLHRSRDRGCPLDHRPPSEGVNMFDKNEPQPTQADPDELPEMGEPETRGDEPKSVKTR